ncbi:DUF2235 domain-containing protein [Shewanella surugensis]|uniref:DUF2235 domain-containing protein n=1 Tax=Shewanella surugensis TaxID=212020 RepID=A0ABT0L8N4_9GAMM|nr:DUF2235 domain-containing protein [Shewanella surugensis]MCL1124046.1 DUF2235 domain-containing protein [Shewanella surugensis]
MSKNIVIFSDGTGQAGHTLYSSNVFKSFTFIDQYSKNQITHYSQGIGGHWWRLTGSLLGLGITNNMLDCYRFIVEHYHWGDNIYLFGFSRGAATVRSLSRFMLFFGLLPSIKPTLISAALKIYQIRDPLLRQHQADRFINQHGAEACDIHFIGVWDTVAALGLPNRFLDHLLSNIPTFRHQFHDFKISANVKHAYHALAIDETRGIFSPLLWRQKAHPAQTLKQVWFSGVHSDVGGGYEHDGLSNIPLFWMLEQAQRHGLILAPNISIKQNIHDTMHNEISWGWGAWLQNKTRFWNKNISNKPTIHASVLERNLNTMNQRHPEYQPWILQGQYHIEPWNRDTTLPPIK